MEMRSIPGAHVSETTVAEVRVYHQDNDPLAFVGPVGTQFRGRAPADFEGLVVGVQTQSALGAAGGSWTVQLKPARSIILDQVVDDDWVEIVFKRHGRQWSVMRGLVKNMREQERVGRATQEVVTLSGVEWGNIYEMTPMWFNRYSLENVGGEVMYRVWNAENIGGSIAKVVETFLDGMLRELSGYGRANWVLPKGLPGRIADAFVDNVQFHTDDWADDPERIAISPVFMAPEGDAWSLAQEWSDPLFCELYTEFGGPFGGDLEIVDGVGQELLSDDALLQVKLRDRIFPTVEQGMASPWFTKTPYVVPRQGITASDVGRSGAERYNAFFVMPQLIQELIGLNLQDLVAPLWSPEDIKRHGLRRFDVMTRYRTDLDKSLDLAETLRTRIRDWYCMNPYLYSGTISLNHGRPDIRKASKLQIPGYNAPLDDVWYYVEGTANNWAFGRGARTDLTVTRGWKGEETAYLDALNKLVSGYEVPKIAQPGEQLAAISAGVA